MCSWQSLKCSNTEWYPDHVVEHLLHTVAHSLFQPVPIQRLKWVEIFSVCGIDTKKFERAKKEVIQSF